LKRFKEREGDRVKIVLEFLKIYEMYLVI